ncbi:MAG: AbrB/MazE/SpoVT family DNA-binding domain-containing protein [Cytophagales bacterium]|nr:AbrB/MazE/SpoVT family DNA-binding domain-containing protein [Cytophagales bacterium]
MAFETIDIQNNEGFQAIQIPKQLEIKDNKVYLKKIGNTLYIIPYNKPWQSMIDSLSLFTEDFMNDRDQPDEQNRENID